MKKIGWFLALTVIFSFSAGVVMAYPPCEPYTPPNLPGSFCRAGVNVNGAYGLVRGVAFVWLRTAPSSDAPSLYTVYASGHEPLVAVGSAVWDGYQWWWEVTFNAGQTIKGWVESASLFPVMEWVSTPTSVTITDPSIQIQANWTTPFRAQVEAGVPYLWMHDLPNSPVIMYTLQASDQVRVISSPEFDGYQWWWLVEVNRQNTLILGWVEQGSLTPIS